MLGGGPGAAASREPPGPCRVKTVTVSTLPVLRENDISWSGAPPPAAAAAADSRLLLFVRSELPGRVAVQDDLDNTELPFFTLDEVPELPVVTFILFCALISLGILQGNR
ncbi:astrotactin-2 [Grus japonensis]|uniref:Astrotactin-2 n=1 Tax=Grus japonensis TaxID=30415 RepID=A0ABC9XLT2_GRUJA